jgi:hypothetical protein
MSPGQSRSHGNDIYSVLFHDPQMKISLFGLNIFRIRPSFFYLNALSFKQGLRSTGSQGGRPDKEHVAEERCP